MSIKWLSNRSVRGVVTISRHCILLNVTALSNLVNAFKVLVGITDDGNVVIKGIKRDEIGKFDENNLISFTRTNTYLRIASTDTISELIESLHIPAKSLPRKYVSIYDQKEDYLIVHTDMKVK